MNPTTDPTSALPLDERMILNGVDALSGHYLTPPFTPEALLDLALSEFRQTSRSDQKLTTALSDKTSQPHLGFDASLDELSEARWGVIFAAQEDRRIQQALEPLIKHRAEQLGFQPPVFEYRPDWTAIDFLAQRGVSRGLGEVAKVPYYLLIVGDPRQVPFRFQYELDSEYATGRLCFDSPEDYGAYVQSLIDYETAGAVPTSREAVFWATANEDDRPTLLSSKFLAQPLYDRLNPQSGFHKRLFRAAEATKANLTAAFARSQPPALLFTASHGLGFREPDAQQPRLQGALVTQEWEPDTPITPAESFSGADLVNGMNVHGLVHFAFACYGAGTPSHDDFAHGRSRVAPIIAEQPFVAYLPRQLLRRGALGFIGHVERAWGYSFIGPTSKPQTVGFERAINALLSGVPVAHALRDMHDRGTQLSSSLLEDLNDLDFGKSIPPLAIAEKWKERNDARGHILVGDPAARLRVKDMR